MKICVSATAPGLDALVDPRFGRCQYFTFVDLDTMESESLLKIPELRPRAAQAFRPPK